MSAPKALKVLDVMAWTWGAVPSWCVGGRQ
jgi:hypothetical protein